MYIYQGFLMKNVEENSRINNKVFLNLKSSLIYRGEFNKGQPIM